MLFLPDFNSRDFADMNGQPLFNINAILTAHLSDTENVTNSNISSKGTCQAFTALHGRLVKVLTYEMNIRE
jgi:hypothetical protein